MTSMIKAIIIDDEERARNVLKTLLEEYCPEVEIVALCSNVPEAVITINKCNPDVVFCDIEMPDYSGFELLSFFKDVNFEIIFATGYGQYAIQAFEVSAVDYLLKPIQIDKLQNAVEKLKSRRSNSMQVRMDTLQDNLRENSIRKIALPNLGGLQFVDVNDIELLEADGSYTNVFLSSSERIVVSKKIKDFEEILLKKQQFFRVHRSAIVNINCIKNYSKAESYIYLDNEKSVPVSRNKKVEFESYIQAFRV